MQEKIFKIYTVKYIGRACFISMNHLLRMFSKGLYLDGKYPIKQNHTSSKSSTKVQCNKLISVLGHKLYGLCYVQFCNCALVSALQHVKWLPSLSSVQCATPLPPRLTSLKPLLGICQQLNKWKKVDASQDMYMKLRYIFVYGPRIQSWMMNILDTMLSFF